MLYISAYAEVVLITLVLLLSINSGAHFKRISLIAFLGGIPSDF